MRRMRIPITLLALLMVLALPAVASAQPGPAVPGSPAFAQVLDAIANLLDFVTPTVTVSPAPSVQAKDDDDRDDEPPLDEVSASINPGG